MGMRANSVGGGDGVRRRARRFWRDERGATAIEYTLIVGLIFLAVVGAIRAYTNTTDGMYDDINTTLSDAVE